MKNNQKLKCSYADKYKAIRKPTCGCQCCEDKYKIKTIKERNRQ